MHLRLTLATLLALASGFASGAPDELLLGRESNYPLPPIPTQTHQQRYIVGSFSGMDTILPHCSLAPSPTPLALKTAGAPHAITYRFQGRAYSLDDYVEHQRATAVLVLKDGEIVAERYNYARTADMRMLSNSMGKTLVALAVGKALEEGSIRSITDTADSYATDLKGTLLGGTRIVDLLRMASGMRYVEDYSPNDDRARYTALARREGVLAAVRSITERAAEPGQRFSYAGPHTEVLGLVLRAATRRSMCDYIAEKIWQPMGAEARATFLTYASDGNELAQGGFNATARDYARLGLLMMNDGQAQGRQVVPREYILDMTDAARQPPQFRPGQMEIRGSRALGYGFQTWLAPSDTRQFALLGVYGQAIFVDPARKLVMVHLAVGKDAVGDASGTRLGAERWALWRGVVAQVARQD